MMRRLLLLFRPKLSLMNGVTALAGFLLVPAHHGGAVMGAAFSGVTMLAMGASALNQVLERDLDGSMRRTLGRPLPQGLIRPATATAVGVAVCACGLVLLAIGGGGLPVALGVLALFWYLAVYTGLKRHTPLALLLGAICGALPPVIGWCMAGGHPADFRIALLAGLFYLWQVPHFWLFQQRHAEDYRRGGIPLFEIRSGMLGLWIAAMAAAALLLPAFGAAGRHAALWYLGLLPPLLVMSLARLDRVMFFCFNLFPLLLLLALAVR